MTLGKTIIHTLNITTDKRSQLFEILLPENFSALVGISVSAIAIGDPPIIVVGGGDVGGVTGAGGEGRPPLPSVNLPFGFIRIFMADKGDELFSEAVYPTGTDLAELETGRNFMNETSVNANQTYRPFLTRLCNNTTVLNGFYQETVAQAFDYEVKIYLHFKNTKQ